MIWQQGYPQYRNSNDGPWCHEPNPKHPNFSLIQDVLNTRMYLHYNPYLPFKDDERYKESYERDLARYNAAVEALKADEFTYNYYLEKGFDK